MCVQDTTTHEGLLRTTELFGIPCLDVSVDDTKVTHKQLVAWLRRRFRIESPSVESESRRWRAEVLPRSSDIDPDSSVELAGRDRLNIMHAHRSYVLSCRNEGNIYRLLTEQLSAETTPRPLVLLADGAQLSEPCRRKLLNHGAILWLVEGLRSERTRAPAAERQLVDSHGKIGPLASPHEWLCHWTRPCAGEWPGQSRSDYLDELILGCATTDRSALASLLRIVTHRQILASRIREESHAVSFTEVPLHEFRNRRVYRRHRRRYDFESWGIAVRRDVLESRGTQRVKYVPRESWDSLRPDETVWYQPAADLSQSIDWREEREWRLPTNLQLDELPRSSVCVFVNSPEELDVLRSACDWPVVVVPMSNGSTNNDASVM